MIFHGELLVITRWYIRHISCPQRWRLSCFRHFSERKGFGIASQPHGNTLIFSSPRNSWVFHSFSMFFPIVDLWFFFSFLRIRFVASVRSQGCHLKSSRLRSRGQVAYQALSCGKPRWFNDETNVYWSTYRATLKNSCPAPRENTERVDGVLSWIVMRYRSDFVASASFCEDIVGMFGHSQHHGYLTIFFCFLLLQEEPRLSKEGEPHGCPLCPSNLCKVVGESISQISGICCSWWKLSKSIGKLALMHSQVLVVFNNRYQQIPFLGATPGWLIPTWFLIFLLWL